MKRIELSSGRVVLISEAQMWQIVLRVGWGVFWRVALVLLLIGSLLCLTAHGQNVDNMPLVPPPGSITQAQGVGEPSARLYRQLTSLIEQAQKEREGMLLENGVLKAQTQTTATLIANDHARLRQEIFDNLQAVIHSKLLNDRDVHGLLREMAVSLFNDPMVREEFREMAVKEIESNSLVIRLKKKFADSPLAGSAVALLLSRLGWQGLYRNNRRLQAVGGFLGHALHFLAESKPKPEPKAI